LRALWASARTGWCVLRTAALRPVLSQHGIEHQHELEVQHDEVPTELVPAPAAR
jgi:hypothetical protein